MGVVTEPHEQNEPVERRAIGEQAADDRLRAVLLERAIDVGEFGFDHAGAFAGLLLRRSETGVRHDFQLDACNPTFQLSHRAISTSLMNTTMSRFESGRWTFFALRPRRRCARPSSTRPLL